MMNQSLLRFAIDATSSPHPNSSAWKQAITAAWNANEATPLKWSDLYIYSGATALTIGASSPWGADFITAHVAPIMGAVAKAAGRMLLVEMTSMSPACEFKGTRWKYTIPKLVVAKPSDKNWQTWREENLDANSSKTLAQRIHTDLQDQFVSWGLCTRLTLPEMDISIIDDGRPMVLKSSIQADPKPVSVLARLGLVFTSNARIEGGFFAGPLKGLGYGRIYRDGMQYAD